VDQTIDLAARAEETAGEVYALTQGILGEVEKVIVGKRDTVRLALAALLAGGHVLIEDIPGVGKTSLAKALARSLGCSFKRIQFTPDLLPSDITGIAVYNQRSMTFEFREGAVFANVVLADEINRASPKTQSSLLESMEEAQVTSDGVTHPLPRPFFVIATQNQIELQGTYPLPEAQLDRFMLRISMGYPSAMEEAAILASRMGDNPLGTIHPVTDAAKLAELQKGLHTIFVDESIRDWVVKIVKATRSRPELFLGASPRGTLNLVYAARALAAMAGRSYTTPDDVKAVAVSVLAHRLVLKPELRLKGATTADVVQDVVDSLPCPMSHAKR